MIEWLPRQSRYVRAVLGEAADWSTDSYLLANVYDALRILIWQQTEDGARKKPKHFPKRIWRPGDVEEIDDDGSNETTFGAQGMTTADVDAYFARIREGQVADGD